MQVAQIKSSSRAEIVAKSEAEEREIRAMSRELGAAERECREVERENEAIDQRREQRGRLAKALEFTRGKLNQLRQGFSNASSVSPIPPQNSGTPEQKKRALEDAARAAAESKRRPARSAPASPTSLPAATVPAASPLASAPPASAALPPELELVLGLARAPQHLKNAKRDPIAEIIADQHAREVAAGVSLAAGNALPWAQDRVLALQHPEIESLVWLEVNGRLAGLSRASLSAFRAKHTLAVSAIRNAEKFSAAGPALPPELLPIVAAADKGDACAREILACYRQESLAGIAFDASLARKCAEDYALLGGKQSARDLIALQASGRGTGLTRTMLANRRDHARGRLVR